MAVDGELLAQEVLKGSRAHLARAITLVESDAAKHKAPAQDLLRRLAPHAGQAVRIGVTGVPGAGKSTFLDAFGSHLCELGKRLAVLAIDPSSSLSGGSVLGDKTRMERLSQNDAAFIRPSPSAGTLGGVHKKTREAMLVCEAAGFDVIIVETVGVGQSETLVSEMVDFFMLLAITGAGDELQGIKKGIMELADVILINKADGDNAQKAERTASDLNQVLHYLSAKTQGWQTKAVAVSALSGLRIGQIWSLVNDYLDHLNAEGLFETRRQEQRRTWFKTLLEEELLGRLLHSAPMRPHFDALQARLESQEIALSEAVDSLLKHFAQEML